MTLQAWKENHTGPDRTADRNADPTTGRTAEVVVHDPSIYVGSMKNA
jgi:hypothetical protein